MLCNLIFLPFKLWISPEIIIIGKDSQIFVVIIVEDLIVLLCLGLDLCLLFYIRERCLRKVWSWLGVSLNLIKVYTNGFTLPRSLRHWSLELGATKYGLVLRNNFLKHIGFLGYTLRSLLLLLVTSVRSIELINRL